MHVYFSSHQHNMNWVNLVVLRLKYFRRTRQISWLLVPWLLALPGHQTRYWPYTGLYFTGGTISTTISVLRYDGEHNYSFKFSPNNSEHNGLSESGSCLGWEHKQTISSCGQAWCHTIWTHNRQARQPVRLLNSPNLVVIGLSVGYETWLGSPFCDWLV